MSAVVACWHGTPSCRSVCSQLLVVVDSHESRVPQWWAQRVGEGVAMRLVLCPDGDPMGRDRVTLYDGESPSREALALVPPVGGMPEQVAILLPDGTGLRCDKTRIEAKGLTVYQPLWRPDQEQALRRRGVSDERDRTRRKA